MILFLMPLAQVPLRAQLKRFMVVYNSRSDAGTTVQDTVKVAGFLSDGTLTRDPDSPPTICSAGSSTENPPVVVPDGYGGLLIATTVEHRDSAGGPDKDIYVLRTDSNGTVLWGNTPPGVAIARSKYIEQSPRLVVLPNGTFMAVYEVHYGTSPASDVDIAAVCLNLSDGKPAWQSGVWAMKTKRREKLVDAVYDGNHRVLVVAEATTYQNNLLKNSDVYVACVDSSSAVGWIPGRTDPTPLAASKHLERNASTVSDGAGGLFAAYEIEYVDGTRKGDVDVLAQHLMPDGNRAWVNTQAPPIVSSDPSAREYAPSISIVESHDIVVAFMVNAKAQKSRVTVVGVQRCDQNGQAAWNKGRKPRLIAVNKHIPSNPKIITDKMNNVFVLTSALDTVNNNRDVYAQMLDNKTGALQWGNTDERFVPVFSGPDDEIFPDLLPDDNGNLYVLATKASRQPDTPGLAWLVVQRMAMDGSLPWAAVGNSPLALTRNRTYDSLGKMLNVY